MYVRRQFSEQAPCDGGLCSKGFQYPESDEEYLVNRERDLVRVRGHSDSFDYAMNYPLKSKCYIFNHMFFKFEDLNPRHGTNKDAEKLERLFRKMGFEVNLYNDLTILQIMDTLREASQDVMNAHRGCVVCCFLSHGGSNGVLHAHDGPYTLNTVVSFFKGDKCKGLLGKPKLFFIQACRTNDNRSTDPGADISYDCAYREDGVGRIPLPADFLISYSTPPDYVSYRTACSGSWFIQTLIPVMEKHANHMDLLQMLTIVNRKMALEKETPESDNPLKDKKKQSGYFSSTLTKLVKFNFRRV